MENPETIVCAEVFVIPVGSPRCLPRLRSDNGKNFVRANREARHFSDGFEMEEIQSELSSRNEPVNPSEGGV